MASKTQLLIQPHELLLAAADRYAALTGNASGDVTGVGSLAGLSRVEPVARPSAAPKPRRKGVAK